MSSVSNMPSASNFRIFGWRTLLVRVASLLGAGYRPELHYMRGPGPASRRKNSGGGGDGIQD
jgi:hypothetical protein